MLRSCYGLAAAVVEGLGAVAIVGGYGAVVGDSRRVARPAAQICSRQWGVSDSLQVFGAGDAQFQVAAAGIFDQRVGGQDTAVVNVGITAEGKFKQLSDTVTVGVGGIQRIITAEIVIKLPVRVIGLVDNL